MSSEQTPPGSQTKNAVESFEAHRVDRRENVADQPGLSRSLVGIVLAVFCGILVQAAFSEEMISDQVRRASERIHQDVWIEFDHADLSLADGPFPEFAIVVRGVRLASSDPCWLAPLAEVDELRLPVDFSSLLRGKIEISEVKLGQVNLQLRGSPEACRHSRSEKWAEKSAKETSLSGAASSANPSEDPLLTPQHSRGPISRISVYNLQIHYLPIPFTSFDISRLSIDRESESPLALRAQGDLNLGGATLSGDYSSRARVNIEYRHPEIIARMNGTWREGTYHLQMESDADQKTLGLSGRIDHLPLSQILPVLTKYDVLKGEYDGRQVWLNLKFKSPQRERWNKGIPLDIENLGLEGDLGQIEGGGFRIQQWDPLEFSNTEISLRGLQVEKLLRLFGKTEKYKSLGSLGELNGLLKVLGNRKFELTGQYSGLELIFSNGRERQTQVISLMTGVLRADRDEWNLHIDRIRAADALVIGEIHLDGNLEERRLHAKVQIDEMSLSPTIQTMMTNGGNLGRWAFDFEGEWVRSSLRHLQGQVLAQDLLLDGVGVSKIRAQIQEGRARDLQFEIRANQLVVQENSRLRTILSPLASSVGQSFQGKWAADQVQANFEIFPDERVSWRLRPVHFNLWQLRSEGGWNASGDLKAQVQVRAKERESRWKVEGHRDSPIFIEEK